MLIDKNINEIINKYLLTIANYTKFFYNNITICTNKNYLENLYIKGLTIIQNIFNISLLYVDSLVDIYNLCEKGYVYFVEFINQINISNINESDFELTTKDAIIFCYKKTIFLFENKISAHNINNEKQLFNILNLYIIIINGLYIIINYKLPNLLEKNNCNYEIQPTMIQNITNILNNNILYILKLIKKLNTNLNIHEILHNDADDGKILSNLNNINNFIKFINNNASSISNNPNIDNIYINIYNLIDKYFTKKKYTCSHAFNISKNTHLFDQLAGENINLTHILNNL